MNTFRTALKTLSHPLSLFAIVILLVNDHVLKIVVPSQLTGKLSDFTGLFFFPFLLAGLLGLAGERLGASPRQITGIAFGVTALGFAGIKTMPELNTLTAKVAEIFLGHPTFYVLDPTDLIALVVLPFSWILWRRMEEERHTVSFKPVQVFALGLAVFGTMATSPCPSETKIQRVIALDDTLYIQFGLQKGVVYSGENYGTYWHITDVVPQLVSDTFRQVKSYPIQECVPNRPEECYRISGDTKIEYSHNAGKTWHTVWRAPTWRADYYDRTLNIPLSCNMYFPDFTPLDLTILHINDGEYLLAVALGNQGLMTYRSSTGWLQLGIWNANPTSSGVQLHNLENLLFVLPVETLLWVLLSLAVPHSLISKWRSSGIAYTKKQQYKKLFFFIFPILFILMWHSITKNAELEIEIYPILAMLGILALLGGGVGTGWAWFITIPVIFLLFMVYLLWIKAWIRKAIYNDFLIGQFRAICLRSALIIFLAGWLPFAFWAFGWIPVYWLAFILSFGLAIVVYLKALHTLEKLKIGDSLPE